LQAIIAPPRRDYAEGLLTGIQPMADYDIALDKVIVNSLVKRKEGMLT
jgi:hypothetical protein